MPPRDVVRFVLIVACTFAGSHRTIADTFVGGSVVADATWSLAGSPYILLTDVVIGPYVTLTIQPGVEVRAGAGLSLTVGSRTFGPATLKAIGTAEQPITFTKTSAGGSPGQWRGIHFTDYATNAIFATGGTYIAGCTLERCVIEFAGAGDDSTGAITIESSSPFINFCEIRHNARSGIRAVNPALTQPPLVIRNCNIHDNVALEQPGGGVFADIKHLKLNGNVIQANTAAHGGGVYVSANIYLQTADFENNVISNNQATGDATIGGRGGGIFAASSDDCTWTLVGNTLTDNQAAASGGSNGRGGGLYVTDQGISSTTGVWLFGDQSADAYNIIAGNTAADGSAIYNDLLFDPAGNTDIHAEYVCWGTGDFDEVAGMIYDHSDDPDKGVVLISPLVTAPDCRGGITGVTLISANPPLDNPFVTGQQPFRDVLQTGTNAFLTQGIGSEFTPAEDSIVYGPISVTFSAAPDPAPDVKNITVSCTGGELCPTVAFVNDVGKGAYQLVLYGIIPPGHCTTIAFSGTARGQKLQYQSLPGDVNLNGLTSSSDALALISAISSGAAAPPANLPRYDINRSGGVSSTHLLRLVGLLNGLETSQPWTGVSVAPCL